MNALLQQGRALLIPKDTAGIYFRDGSFEFTNVRGKQQLRVHSIGHMPAVADITVPPDSGVIVVAALEQRSLVIDEMCGTRQRRR